MDRPEGSALYLQGGRRHFLTPGKPSFSIPASRSNGALEYWSITGTAAEHHHRRYRRPALFWSCHLKSREAAVCPNSSSKEQYCGAKAQIFAIQLFGGVAH